MEQDMAKLDEMSAELDRITRETANELNKRLAVETTESVPTYPSSSTAQLVRHKRERKRNNPIPTESPSPSTSTAPTVGDRVAANVPSVQSNIPVPTDTIIAFSDRGKNEILRKGTNKWTEWEEDRECGWWHVCVKAHLSIYFIGGTRGGQPYSSETDIYDISKEQWSKGPQLNVGRHGAAACFDMYNSQIVVVGGDNGDHLNSVERLKVDGQGMPIVEWEQMKKSMMSKRNFCATALLHDKLFVSGGHAGDNVTTSVEMLDLRSSAAKWKECAPMNEKRACHAMIAFNNQLFVFGAYNGKNKLASCEKYSPMNNTWQKISNMRVPRSSCGVCLMGDRIYVVGGYTSGFKETTTVEVYNPNKDEWTEGPELTTPSGKIQCVTL